MSVVDGFVPAATVHCGKGHQKARKIACWRMA
jgi:hypothetical protein